MTDTVTSLNIDLSSWNILYITIYFMLSLFKFQKLYKFHIKSLNFPYVKLLD
jgi:hypothetical protein